MRLPFKGLYPLTQEFGVNPQYYKQFLVKYPDGSVQPMRGHNGLDFGTPHRTEVIAPHDGQVIEATLDQKGYGWYVKIENAVMGSVLAHLDAIDVQVGFRLNEGDHIGWSDNTGYSSGPHLHWGWYVIPRDRSNGIAGFYDQTAELAKASIIIKLNELPKNTMQVVPPQNMSGKLWTDEEYQAAMNDRKKFWDERDEAIAKLKALQGLYDNEHSIITGFQAMGYTSIDDVTKALNKKDEDVVGLTQQVASALQRSKTLALLLAGKDEEDSTAVEKGLDALVELKDLRSERAEIAKVAEAGSPAAREIVRRITFFKDLAERWIKKQEADTKIQQEKTIEANKPQEKKQSLGDSLLQLFNL